MRESGWRHLPPCSSEEVVTESVGGEAQEVCGGHAVGPLCAYDPRIVPEGPRGFNASRALSYKVLVLLL
jgi:hypothetical protein